MSEMDAPPKMEQFWEDPPGSACQNQLVLSGSHGAMMSGSTSTTGSSSQQYERNLNFATGAVEENEYGFPKKKTVRDPLSHRIIEKRRRDRMNNCLADLARLLPPSSLRKGRGRIEKTEIVELAIKHLRHLQCHPCPTGEKCEFNYIAKSSSKEILSSASQGGHVNNAHHTPSSVMSGGSMSLSQSSPEEHFRLGFHECMSETMTFLVEEEGMYPGDGMCVRMLQHLRAHSENLMRDHFGKDGKLSLSARPKDEIRVKSVKGSDITPEFSATAGSNGSTCSGYQQNGSSSGSDGNGGQDGEANETFVLPVPNVSQHRSSGERDRSSGVNIEYDGENSCCSTQLSLDISDVLSVESKNTRSAGCKPPIPAIICSSSSVHSSPVVLSSSNGRSSDEGQEGMDGSSNSSNSQHRYKFKNNIKQRFNADQVQPEDLVGCKQGRKHATKASLKQTEEPRGEAPTTSDLDLEEEEAIMKLRNSSPVEMIDEECSSRKNFASSTRRNSGMGLKSQSGGVKMVSTSSQTSVSSDQSLSQITPAFQAIATSAGLTEIQCIDRDMKLSREELVKSLTPIELEKSPVPLILGDRSGENSPFLGSSKNAGVPAFALHEKGLYYVPLTIDKSILSPYLAKLEPSTSPPLHPVTISVCFLLSPAESKLRLDLDPNNPKQLSPVLPLSSVKVSSKVPHEFTVATIPLSLPSAIKVPKSSRDPSNSFSVNRFAQSRQYSPASYRYPMSSSGSGSCISLGSSHLGSGGPSHSPYHPSGYYMNSSEGSPGHSLLPLPPTHITAGYGSSSSSSSSSGGNSSRVNRKRSVCNVSPMSGSSSLGYHSLHDKYAPSSQDFYGYPSNTQPTSHSHIHSSSGSSSGSSSFSGHHHHVSSTYSYGSHGSSSSSGHLGSIHDDKNSSSPGEAEKNRRSCSPSKKVKRSRDGDEILKPKPLHVGLPIIPLPHSTDTV